MAEYDYSDLPEVVWVQIMSYLHLTDKSCLSRTCHTLHELFHHPSVWHHIIINMLGDQTPWCTNKTAPVIVAERPLMLTKKFGAYFQDVTILLEGFMKSIPPDTADVIRELSRDCRLEKLTLQVGTMLTKTNARVPIATVPQNHDLGVFADLIKNAFRMKSFTLISWPRFQNVKVLDVLEELVANPKLLHLETLSLYWVDATEKTWTTNNAILPPPQQVLGLVEHFQYLTTLKLRSTMINDKVIETLSHPGHQPLQHLHILVTYTSLEKATSIKTISSEAWTKLHLHSPAIGAHFSIMTRIPYIELAALLKPEVPLVSISFMKYSRCDDTVIASLQDKYNKTLSKFVDFTDGADNDEVLLSLVSACPQLDRFVYNGTLHHHTVHQLAQLCTSQWKLFKVNVDKISTKPPAEGSEDDDSVLQIGADGDYSTPITRGYQPEEQHHHILDDLSQKLSLILGYKWQPFTDKDLFQ